MELTAHQIAIIRAMKGVIKLAKSADIITADTGKLQHIKTLTIMREMVKKS